METVTLRLVRLVPGGDSASAFRRLLLRRVLGGVGNGAVIHPSVEFVWPEGVRVGDRVTLWPQCHLYCAGDNNSIHLASDVTLDRGVIIKCLNFDAGDSTTIEIGQRSLIGPYVCIFGPGDVRIGHDCLISSHTGIYANSHVFSDPQVPIRSQGITRRGITIEDDCWLGHGSTVMDGVTIGRGSIVSAGAVVMRDVAPFSIVAGVPAKVISRRAAASFAASADQSEAIQTLEHIDPSERNAEPA